MHKNQGPVYYSDYLHLKKLLGSQVPLSKKYGAECHDETLFILVHQSYELWFKQIIHELKYVTDIFSKKFVEEKDLSDATAKLERIIKIQGMLVTKLEVLETMSPMDFLEFRDLLIPASGFQSIQFREIEIRMGLGTEKRKGVDREYFLGRLNDEDKNHLLKIEEEANILGLLEKWLERLPFTTTETFDFWEHYENAVKNMVQGDHDLIKNNPVLSDKQKTAQLANQKATEETFQSLLDRDKFDQLHKEGKRRLSRKAMMNALFILLYRDEPLLNWPYRFINYLMDIDENFTTWRHRHALMGHRMLGTKIGTGGSSGHEYLKRAAEHNRAFTDLFDLSTFIIPRSMLPELPTNIRNEMNFRYNRNDK